MPPYHREDPSCLEAHGMAGPGQMVHPAPEQLVVLLLCLDEGLEPMFLIAPHVQ